MYGTPQAGYGYPAPYGPYFQRPPVKTSVGGLSVALTVLFSLEALFALLDTGALAWRNSILGSLLDDRVSVDENTVKSSDNLVRTATGLLGLTTIAAIVVFICWFWAARKNAECYRPDEGTLSTGWSIGGWFIPVANLVLPCIVARDIYKGTMSGRRPGKPTGGGQITGWWWASYVVASVLLGVLNVENGNKDDSISPYEYLSGMRDATRAGMVALPVMAVAAVLAIAYVQTITKTQKARNAEGDWYDGPGSRAAQGLPPVPAGYGYGHGMPVQSGFPESVPTMDAVAMPAPPPAPTQDAVAMPAPIQDAVPPQYRQPADATQAAETQTAEARPAATVDDDNPFAAPPESPGLIPPG